MIIEIAINSICVPRCFAGAAAASALQKTNIHCRQAPSCRPLMRGASLPLSCVTVLKSLHGGIINFFSSPSVLVCLRKTKTARVPACAWCHPLWCHLLCSHSFSLCPPRWLAPRPAAPRAIPFPACACVTLSHVRRVISVAIIKQMEPIQKKTWRGPGFVWIWWYKLRFSSKILTCDCEITQMCVCVVGNVGPNIASFTLFSIFATVIMM